MFSGFSQYIHAAAQARAMARLAQQQREIGDEMQKRQDLAYDAERWPHCMDLPTAEFSSPHRG